MINMAHSQSSTAHEIPVFVDSTVDFSLSVEAKDELQRLSPNLDFADDDDVLKQFKCQKCQQIVFSHCAANCKHFFCRKCFNENFQQPCPVADCPNKFIFQGEQNQQLEIGLGKLRVKCIWQKYGCQEILSLSHLLDHQEKCPVFTQMLIPRKLKLNDKSGIYNDQQHEDVTRLKYLVERLENKIENLETRLSEKISDFEMLTKNVRENLKDELENGLRKNLEESSVKTAEKLKVDLNRYFTDEISKKLARQRLDLEKRLQSKFSEELVDQQRESKKQLGESMSKEAEINKTALENKTQVHLKEQIALYQMEFQATATEQLDAKVEHCKNVLTNDLMKQLQENTKKYKEGLKKYICAELNTSTEKHKNDVTSLLETQLNGKFQQLSSEFKISIVEQLSMKCDCLYEKLLSDLDLQSKTNSENVKDELLIKITQKLTRQFDEEVKDSERNITNKVIEDLNRYEDACKLNISNDLENKTTAQYAKLEQEVSKKYMTEFQAESDKFDAFKIKAASDNKSFGNQINEKIADLHTELESYKIEISEQLSRKLAKVPGPMRF